MSEETAKKVIVVIEDNEHIGTLIKETLNEEPDYQAVLVLDSAQALEVIRSVKANLILMDLNLPGIDGIQLYEMLQADELTRDTPVIFVTANALDPRLQEATFDPVILPKPFSLDDLLEQVARVCRPEQN